MNSWSDDLALDLQWQARAAHESVPDVRLLHWWVSNLSCCWLCVQKERHIARVTSCVWRLPSLWRPPSPGPSAQLSGGSKATRVHPQQRPPRDSTPASQATREEDARESTPAFRPSLAPTSAVSALLLLVG